MLTRATDDYQIRTGLVRLLEIKDSDIRIMTIRQGLDAVDKGIHIGGALSATLPLVSLYYGGFVHFDVVQPTRRGQDMFVLSKGHAVATLASIYADLGYFDRNILRNSRSIESMLNGHPGPLLPGCHISTGPLGQGLSVAEGFALVGKRSPSFDVFCMTGDGELQEGPIWEAIMFSSHRRLDNLCVLIDENAGQHDDTKQLVLPLCMLDKKLESFDWKVLSVDATQYGPVIDALEEFKFGSRDGRPTAIVCHTRKGYGGFSNFMAGHKVTMPDVLGQQEIALQEERRKDRVAEFFDFFADLESMADGDAIRKRLVAISKEINLDIGFQPKGLKVITPVIVPPRIQRAPVRDKRIIYDASQLPKLDKSKEYMACNVVTMAMKVFALDSRVASIDADLGRLSGLEAGIGYVDVDRALNVGLAESNMMGIGEALAALGSNTWVSTFAPFFDWRVLRRIAIGYQERLEAMGTANGWLNDGHGLDLTFLATSANLDTQANGATHMGNDDMQVFEQVAHVKIIDVCCPNQLLGVMKWIMEGNRGLIYLRIMRGSSAIIYDDDFQFEFGKGYVVRHNPDDTIIIISSGRGVHEALSAARKLEQAGMNIRVVDMPSIDEELLLTLHDSQKLIVIAEQNNGHIWSEYRRILFNSSQKIDTKKCLPLNLLDKDGCQQFIHSATYTQLLDRFGLSADRLAETILRLPNRTN